MKGKQLKGLVKVLSVFDDIFDARCKDIVDYDHVIYCRVTPKSGEIFGTKVDSIMDLNLLSRLDIEPNVDYDVSTEKNIYILRSDTDEIKVWMLEGECSKLKNDVTKYDKYTDKIVVPASDLKKAMKRLGKFKSEFMSISKGRLLVETPTLNMSILLKESKCESSSMFRTDLLKKVIGVTSGYVMISYGDDTLLNLKWSDEYYEYDAYIAGCYHNQ